MIKILLLILLLSGPIYANDRLPGKQSTKHLCVDIADVLKENVKHGYINKQVAQEILGRCLMNS